VAEIEDAPAVEPTTTAGVDVGLKSLITTSAGESIYFLMVSAVTVPAVPT